MLKKKIFFISKNFNKYKLGELFFLTGIFFLCSSIVLAGIFLIPSLIYGSVLQFRKNFFSKNPWQISFLICGILIIFNALLQKFIIPNKFPEIWDPNLSLIGTANWIPLFWVFWACQPFLNSTEKRRTFSLIILAGSFPLLLTGFGQYYFNWIGPYRTLNGLITWYLRPTVDNIGNLTGLFNNANYTGTWFNLILPFCIAFVFEKTKNFFKKSISISFLIAIGFSIFLTNSRNAWLGLSLVLPLFIGKEGIILIIFGVFLLIFLISPIFSGELQSNLINLLPDVISSQIDISGYDENTRLNLLVSAIEYIKMSPITGIGAASFPSIYQLEKDIYYGHSHNLFTELAVSYGVPVTIIFAGSIISLLVVSYDKIFLRKKKTKNISFIERAFWVSVFFFFISQLADIQYFEGRISILLWILIAALKNIIEENTTRKKLT
tara:strand:- start:17413 stop:18720 length:1308 start_codon:yes stop_codon:yes gene_type:complete